ncbi:MAG: transposase [Candidatus Lokiarchaeota archaeon]|nr:transposase [Candidatus Lokiarchaeota archaeon]
MEKKNLERLKQNAIDRLKKRNSLSGWTPQPIRDDKNAFLGETIPLNSRNQISQDEPQLNEKSRLNEQAYWKLAGQFITKIRQLKNESLNQIFNIKTVSRISYKNLKNLYEKLKDVSPEFSTVQSIRTIFGSPSETRHIKDSLHVHVNIPKQKWDDNCKAWITQFHNNLTRFWIGIFGHHVRWTANLSNQFSKIDVQVNGQRLGTFSFGKVIGALMNAYLEVLSQEIVEIDDKEGEWNLYDDEESMFFVDNPKPENIKQVGATDSSEFKKKLRKLIEPYEFSTNKEDLLDFMTLLYEQDSSTAMKVFERLEGQLSLNLPKLSWGEIIKRYGDPIFAQLVKDIKINFKKLFLKRFPRFKWDDYLHYVLFLAQPLIVSQFAHQEKSFLRFIKNCLNGSNCDPMFYIREKSDAIFFFKWFQRIINKYDKLKTIENPDKFDPERIAKLNRYRSQHNAFLVLATCEVLISRPDQCPECGGRLLRDPLYDYWVCKDCGITPGENKLEITIRPRDYSTEKKRTHWAPRDETTKHQSTLRQRDLSRYPQLKRAQKFAREVDIKALYDKDKEKYIELLAHRLNYPQILITEAILLFRKASEKNLAYAPCFVRGLSGAILFYLARTNSLPHTKAIIANEINDFNVKQLEKCYAKLIEGLNLSYPLEDVTRLVPAILSEVDLYTPQIQQRIETMINQFYEKYPAKVGNPISFIAALLFLLSHEMHLGLETSILAEKLEITTTTIRYYLKMIKSLIEEPKLGDDSFESLVISDEYRHRLETINSIFTQEIIKSQIPRFIREKAPKIFPVQKIRSIFERIIDLWIDQCWTQVPKLITEQPFEPYTILHPYLYDYCQDWGSWTFCCAVYCGLVISELRGDLTVSLNVKEDSLVKLFSRFIEAIFSLIENEIEKRFSDFTHMILRFVEMKQDAAIKTPILSKLRITPEVRKEPSLDPIPLEGTVAFAQEEQEEIWEFIRNHPKITPEQVRTHFKLANTPDIVEELTKYVEIISTMSDYSRKLTYTQLAQNADSSLSLVKDIASHLNLRWRFYKSSTNYTVTRKFSLQPHKGTLGGKYEKGEHSSIHFIRKQLFKYRDLQNLYVQFLIDEIRANPNILANKPWEYPNFYLDLTKQQKAQFKAKYPNKRFLTDSKKRIEEYIYKYYRQQPRFKNLKSNYWKEENLLERAKQNAIRSATYAVRNWVIRNERLKILRDKLVAYLQSTESTEVYSYSQKAKITIPSQREYIIRAFLMGKRFYKEYLRDLSNTTKRNIFGEYDRRSFEEIYNHIGQLKNILYKTRSLDVVFEDAFTSLWDYLQDPPEIVDRFLESCFERFETDGKPLGNVFLKMFVRNVRTKSTKLAAQLIEGKKGFGDSNSPINQLTKDILKGGITHIDSFKEERNQRFGQHTVMETEVVFDREDLKAEVLARLKEYIQDEVLNIPNRHFAKTLFKPTFRAVKIQSLDFEGLINYMITKLFYETKERLPELIFALNIGDDLIRATIKELNNIKMYQLPTPEMEQLTINLTRKQQLFRRTCPECRNKVTKCTCNNPPNSHQFEFRLISGTRGVKGGQNWTTFVLTPRQERRYSRMIRDGYQPKNPVIKLERRKLIVCQPFDAKKAEAPISESVQRQGNEMGIDLGILDFGALSIKDSQTNQYLAEYRLGEAELYDKCFEKGSFEYIKYVNEFIAMDAKNWGRSLKNYVDKEAKPTRIKAKLINLRTEVQKLQRFKAEFESEFPDTYKNHRVWFHRAKSVSLLWNKINKLNKDIINRLSGLIVKIAKYHNVKRIKFEDLRWVKHRKKQRTGKFLAFWQTHWFFSQVQSMVTQNAKRKGIEVVIVEAAYTSQRCAECGVQGTSHKKVFICPHCGFKKDRDLNAARNIVNSKIYHNLYLMDLSSSPVHWAEMSIF